MKVIMAVLIIMAMISGVATSVNTDSNRGKPRKKTPSLKSRSDKPSTKNERRAATLGVEEKQLQVQFAFFLRCRIGNDGQ
jgi:hypothetical protein